jgi:hypothetical protein
MATGADGFGWLFGAEFITFPPESFKEARPFERPGLNYQTWAERMLRAPDTGRPPSLLRRSEMFIDKCPLDFPGSFRSQMLLLPKRKDCTPTERLNP